MHRLAPLILLVACSDAPDVSNEQIDFLVDVQSAMRGAGFAGARCHIDKRVGDLVPCMQSDLYIGLVCDVVALTCMEMNGRLERTKGPPPEGRALEAE